MRLSTFVSAGLQTNAQTSLRRGTNQLMLFCSFPFCSSSTESAFVSALRPFISHSTRWFLSGDLALWRPCNCTTRWSWYSENRCATDSESWEDGLSCERRTLRRGSYSPATCGPLGSSDLFYCLLSKRKGTCNGADPCSPPYLTCSCFYTLLWPVSPAFGSIEN